jgi:hypothetical protein
MTKLRGVLFAILAILGLALGASAQTQPNSSSITFKFRADYKDKIQVALFSQDRDHVWPGRGNAYNLDDSQVYDVKLACRPDENICYGGWVNGNAKLYWGRGAENKHKCDNCCYRCTNNVTPVIRLH